MKFREWLSRLLGVHGTPGQQRLEREHARQQLTEAIEQLRQELKHGRPD